MGKWIVLAGLLCAAGCAKKAKKLVPYAGPLTGERILATRDLVKPFADWSEGLAEMEAQVGKATRVKDRTYAWAVVEGKSCTYVEIEQDDRSKYNKSETGLMVGSIQNPMKVDKESGPVLNWRDCLAITGVTTGPPEDPNAAGPPKDGSAVPLATLRELAIKGRSKWKDQRVKVTAEVDSVSTSTSGSQKSITLSLRTGPDDHESVGCNLAAGAPDPGVLKQDDPITVEGKVAIDEWMSMGGGDATLKVSLNDCSLVPGK